MPEEPKFKLKSINQVCLVVKDIEKTMEAYVRVGVGPWQLFTYTPETIKKESTYRGKPEKYSMKLALTKVGDLALELIQHLDGGTAYKEFIDKFGDGVHHFGMVVESVDQSIKEAQEAGFEVIQTARGQGLHGDGAFAYVDSTKELGIVIELIEAPKVRITPDRIYPS